MTFKVLLPQDIHEEGKRILKEASCELIIPKSEQTEDIKEAIKDCDAVLVRTTVIDQSVIDAAKKLKVIARHGVGLDNVDVSYATEKGIYVCNAPTANVNSVAEHVVGMIVSLFHQIVRANQALRRGDFAVRNQYIGFELKEKTIGLIGIGHIGKLVAEKCHFGFGMNVLAYDPFIDEVPSFIEKVESIDQIFTESDVVSLHVPYRKELHHFVGEKQFNLMKPTAFLINAARGGLVDENALLQAVDNNSIAGAALDCFEEEPTPVNHPLFESNRVIVTPHMAAHSREAMIAMAVQPANEILRVLKGQLPNYAVNQVAKGGEKSESLERVKG